MIPAAAACASAPGRSRFRADRMPPLPPEPASSSASGRRRSPSCARGRRIEAEIVQVEPLGAETIFAGHTPGVEKPVFARVGPDVPVKVGERRRLGYRSRGAHVFDAGRRCALRERAGKIMASASSIEVEMGKRIAVVGSGAVGGYLGGHLARTGNDVTLIDPWPEHIEAIRARGLQLSGMTDEESCTVKLPTMHLTEVQSLSRAAADRHRVRLQQVLRHRMVDDADPAVSCDRRLCGLGAEFDQRGDDRARRRLGAHGRLHRRQQFRRRPVRAGLRAPHHAARLQHDLDLCGETHGRVTARVEELRDMLARDRRGRRHQESVGRTLVETVRQRDAQRRERRDRHERQRARRPSE